MSELPKLTQATLERFMQAMEERGIKAEELNVFQYAGDVVRCAVSAGWLSMDVDQADPEDVFRLSRAIQDKLKRVLDPGPN